MFDGAERSRKVRRKCTVRVTLGNIATLYSLPKTCPSWHFHFEQGLKNANACKENCVSQYESQIPPSLPLPDLCVNSIHSER